MSTAFSSGRIQPSLLPIVSKGLDLTRTKPGSAPGYFKAADAAVILAGQVVARDASGNLVLCTGAGAVGLSKWNKASVLYGMVKDEPIVLTGTAATSLKHPLVAGVLVTSADGATVYTVTTDYVLNATNGTVARNGAGSIPDGATVLVTYRYQLLNSDLDVDGRNFFNNLDDTAASSGRLTMITGPATIFTAAYDTSKQWAVNDVVTCGTDGYPTKGGAGDVIGKVIQAPTAQDPYLGFNLTLLG